MSENANNQNEIEKTAEIVASTATPETASPITSEPPKTEAPKVDLKKESQSALAELGLKDEEPKAEEKPKEGEAPKAEEKPKEGEPKKEEAPKTEEKPKVESYELELADNSQLTEKDLDEAVKFAEKYKWSKEEAENYLKEKEAMVVRGAEALRDKALEIIRQQKEEFMADPDFKGEKMKQSMETIDTVVAKYGDPALRAYLKGPGGNSLPLAKMLLKIGNVMKQDTMHGKGVVGGNSNPIAEKEDAYKNMYPSMFSEN